ncbi:MAG: DUF2147 domain-containing protein [Bacteroidales bacterium]|nr:DUF2147 domain-containing protein [Bacteroidales bacterium]
MKKILLTTALTLCTFTIIFPQTRANDITGLFLAYDPRTNYTSQMEIFRASDGTFSARVVWVEDARQLHTIGTIQIRNLTFDSQSNEWRNGRVMFEGREFRLNARFAEDGRLRIRGFLGISLLGRTQYWIRESELRSS